MASDSQILMHRSRDNLYLKLAGHFDGDAAHELVYTIKTYGIGAYSIFIHTSDLKRIDHSGLDSFRRTLYRLNNHFFGSLIFTGKNSVSMAPKNSQVI